MAVTLMMSKVKASKILEVLMVSLFLHKVWTEKISVYLFMAQHLELVHSILLDGMCRMKRKCNCESLGTHSLLISRDFLIAFFGAVEKLCGYKS